MEPVADEPEVRIRNTAPFKLKDRPSRAYQAIHLEKQFGFIPEVIIVEKVEKKNNTIIVRAIMTPEEIEKEDKLKETLKKEDTPEIILSKK